MIQKDVLRIQKTSSIDAADSSMKRNKIPQLSVMRIIACLAIVVLHTMFAVSGYFRDSISAGDLLVSKTIENNMMWAVPLFLMVTGVLQLDPSRELTLHKLYGKYVKRVFGSLVLFSFVFRIFDMIMDHEVFTVPGLLYAMLEMLTSKGWGHLWYLYLLIGLYIFMPFYRKIAECCSDRELRYLCAVYIVFISLIPLIETSGINIGFYIGESLIYPLYLYLGYMIHNDRLHIPASAAWAAFIISTALIILFDLMKYGGGAAIPDFVFGYSSPLIIIQSAGIFTLLDRISISGSSISISESAIFNSLDKCTFGIYLIHMIFIRLIFRYMHFDPFEMLPGLTFPLCIAGIFLISFAVTLILRRIPVFRKVL